MPSSSLPPLSLPLSSSKQYHPEPFWFNPCGSQMNAAAWGAVERSDEDVLAAPPALGLAVAGRTDANCHPCRLTVSSRSASATRVCGPTDATCCGERRSQCAPEFYRFLAVGCGWVGHVHCQVGRPGGLLRRPRGVKLGAAVVRASVDWLDWRGTWKRGACENRWGQVLLSRC